METAPREGRLPEPAEAPEPDGTAAPAAAEAADGNAVPAREEEWERLKAVLPDCESLEEVPEPARRLAKEERIPLADAYLRFLHRERRLAAEERERQRQAAERSPGPLAGERTAPQPEPEAFRRAFEKALW